jgi:hypothetical protein
MRASVGLIKVKDFVDWCDHVLTRLADEAEQSPTAKTVGMHDTSLMTAVFGEAALEPGFHGSKRHEALMDAVIELARVGLLYK